MIKCSRNIILIELSKNQQIDWYLQAELAYNKRFGDIEFKDPKDKVQRIRFISGMISLKMKSCH